MWKRRFESTSVILQHLNLSSWIAVQIDDLAFETTHWIRLNEINDFKQLFRLGTLGFVYEYVQEHFLNFFTLELQLCSLISSTPASTAGIQRCVWKRVRDFKKRKHRSLTSSVLRWCSSPILQHLWQKNKENKVIKINTYAHASSSERKASSQSLFFFSVSLSTNALPVLWMCVCSLYFQ